MSKQVIISSLFNVKNYGIEIEKERKETVFKLMGSRRKIKEHITSNSICIQYDELIENATIHAG